MNKFQEQLQLIRESIFKGAADEELSLRQEHYKSIAEKEAIEKIKDLLVENPDGSFDVTGDVYWSFMELERIPLKFHRIQGAFIIDHNQLTSLENAPVIVEGEFNCSYNMLDSLKYSPKIVNGAYSCELNDWDFTVDDVKRVCKVTGKIFVND